MGYKEQGALWRQAAARQSQKGLSYLILGDTDKLGKKVGLMMDEVIILQIRVWGSKNSGYKSCQQSRIKA